MWHKKIVVAGMATALIAGLAACSESKADDDVAKSGSATKVTIVLSNKANQSYLPLILADKLGYFKKQGLNVTIKELQETQQVNSAVLAGDAQAAVKFYDSNVVLQAKGKDVVSVLQLLQAPGMVGIARPDAKVKTGKDLDGKTLGVTGLGSATASIAQYLAIHNGVKRENIKLAAVGAGPPFVAAFQNKRVDAGVTTEPTISTLLAKGIGKIFADMRTAEGTKAALGGAYPGTSVTVKTSWAKNNKPTVQKMVNAMFEALQWITAHSAADITAKVPADFYAGPGKEQYTQALANEMGMYNPSGQMPTGAPQTVLRVLQAVNPDVKGKKIDLAKTYTDEYVQQAAKDVKTG